MNRYILPLYFFLFCWILSPAYGQSYLCKTEKLSIKDGLSNRFVRAIVQDSKGFMWFGTKNGLNRYDGYEFKVFSQQNSALQSDFIDKLFEDADHHIWVGHAMNNEDARFFSGIDILNINTFEIQSIEAYFKETLPCLVSDIYQIYHDPATKYLYLTTETGKIYVYKGNKEFELFYEALIPTTIRSFRLGNRYTWIYAGNALIALDSNKQVVHQEQLKINKKYFCNFVGEENDHAVWLEFNDKFEIHRVYFWDTKDSLLTATKYFDYFDESVNIRINAQFEQRSKTGYYIFQNRWEVRIFDENRKLFYSPWLVENRNFIRTVYVDRQENIWIGVMTEGIVKISCQKSKFKSYLEGYSTRGIATICEDSLLVISSYEGRYVYNLKTNEKEKINWFGGLAMRKSQDDNFIWVSGGAGFIFRIPIDNYREENKYVYKSINVKQQENFLGERSLASWAFYEDLKKRLWIGTTNGLFYKDESDDSIQTFTDYRAHPELKEAVINYFHKNDQGLWIASSFGLYLMDKDGVIIRFSKELSGAFHLGHNYIYYIHEDKNGVLWLATRGGGVIRFNPKTGKSEQLTTENGLSHNVIYAILEDKYGFLWMSSDRGLMRLNPKNRTVETYLPEDGILHEEFNRVSAYQASNGILYFGGLSGVIALNPSDFLVKDTTYSPMQILRYQYFNGQKSALVDRTKELIENQKIILDYTDRYFVLDVALLDYKSKDKKQYAYKIEGLDTDWNFVQSNSIRINGLSAGTYTLLVKGQANSGVWTKPIVLPILVKQPFYLTWQFFLLLVIIVIVLILVYSRWRVARLYKIQITLEEEVSKRTKKIEQQANELRELDNVKSRFFANISHELRTPLTLMLGPIGAILDQHYGDDLKKREEILGMAQRNGLQLQSLIEEILVLSKLETKNVELNERKLHLNPFVRRLFLAFEAQANLQEITWHLNSNLEETVGVWLDDKKFEKILNNLLSNALKYTPRGGVVECCINGTVLNAEQLSLKIKVTDSGPGIYPEDLPHIFNRFYQSKHKDAIVEGGTGIGLALSYEFTQLLGGSLRVESKLGKGAIFLLSIPMKLVEVAVPNKTKESIMAGEETSLPDLIAPKTERKEYTVLIVEDNQDMRTFLADLLGSHHQVLTAENGRLALDVLAKNEGNINLILSDVMMPEMDGFELLKQLKEHDNWKKIPIVMLTARATEKDKLFALRIGVDDYLQKPFSRQELLIRIANLLQNYQERRNWEKEDVSLKEEEKGNLIPLTGNEDQWMQELETITKREVGNTQFNIVSLAYNLNLSERQLRRKIKMRTGLTPNQYFRCIKLDAARQYLEKRSYETVAEVAYKVGFSNVHYFSKIYQAQYGKKPIEYLKQSI